jgi:PTH1 family peptidyl-tRNA hydrolase
VADERRLVVGLGNPGPRYELTRHNAGFLVVDLLAERIGARFKAHRSRCDVVEGRLAGAGVVLAKPKGYMNDSGGPVVAVSRFYKVGLEHITVVHDDLDLPFGVVRLKRGGGDGGHNGLRSITAALGGPDYTRVRLGIGRPPGRQDPAEFVLREFSAAERKDLGYVVDRAADAVESLIAHGLEPTQNEYHA